MRITCCLLTLLLLASCSGSRAVSPAEPAETGNARHRVFADSAETVMHAAMLALESFLREGRPLSSGAVKGDGTTVYTGWVYGKRNGKPVRRLYGYTVVPAANGTHVAMNAEEEEKEEGGWNRMPADPDVYPQMLQRLKDQLRALR